MTRALQGGLGLSVTIALGACGTPPAADYGGNWTPVNRYQDAPAEIPLSPTYAFFAAPLDETLKTMLERWAVDAGLTLSYGLGSDFTLYKPVARIRTVDIHAAAADLSAIYAAQGVSVAVEGKQILVRSAAAIGPGSGASESEVQASAHAN
jgi:hypothetical protein